MYYSKQIFTEWVIMLWGMALVLIPIFIWTIIESIMEAINDFFKFMYHVLYFIFRPIKSIKKIINTPKPTPFVKDGKYDWYDPLV